MHTVRRATPEDIATLVELRAAQFTSRDLSDPSEAAWGAACYDWFAHRLNEFSVFIAVVEDNGAVVAMAIGAVRDTAPSPMNPRGGEIAISNVCTAPSARGRGHAQAAYEQVRNWAFETGLGQVHLVDEHAVSYRPNEIDRHAARVRQSHPTSV